MWLFYVEAYLFVLVAFAAGVVVGLAGVRVAVRRVAPAQTPKVKPPKAAKPPKQKGPLTGSEPPEEAAEAASPTSGGTS